MSAQHKAIRLAIAIKRFSDYDPAINEASAELVRLHAMTVELMAALKESRKQVLDGVRTSNVAIASAEQNEKDNTE